MTLLGGATPALTQSGVHTGTCLFCHGRRQKPDVTDLAPGNNSIALGRSPRCEQSALHRKPHLEFLHLRICDERGVAAASGTLLIRECAHVPCTPNFGSPNFHLLDTLSVVHEFPSRWNGYAAFSSPSSRMPDRTFSASSGESSSIPWAVRPCSAICWSISSSV